MFFKTLGQLGISITTHAVKLYILCHIIRTAKVMYIHQIIDFLVCNNHYSLTGLLMWMDVHTLIKD